MGKESPERKAKCPHCRAALDPKPKRKAKCRYCGQAFVVRGGVLLTEEEAAIQDWLSRLESLGVTRKDFDSHRQQLSRQFGFKAPVNDTIWRILNSLITAKADHVQLVRVYVEMAGLLRLEGKDARWCSEEARRHHLLEVIEGLRDSAHSGFDMRLVVSTCNDSLVCPVCQALAKRTYTLAEAESLLTSTCRSEGGCRCSYGLRLAR